VDAGERESGLLPDLLLGQLPPELLASERLQPTYATNPNHLGLGGPDSAGVVVDLLLDALADPVDRIGDEAVPHAGVELASRMGEPDVPRLDEIHERDTMMLV